MCQNQICSPFIDSSRCLLRVAYLKFSRVSLLFSQCLDIWNFNFLIPHNIKCQSLLCFQLSRFEFLLPTVKIIPYRSQSYQRQQNICWCYLILSFLHNCNLFYFTIRPILNFNPVVRLISWILKFKILTFVWTVPWNVYNNYSNNL